MLIPLSRLLRKKRNNVAFASRERYSVIANTRSTSSNSGASDVIPNVADSDDEDQDDDEFEDEIGEDGEICSSQTKNELMRLLILDLFLPLAKNKQVMLLCTYIILLRCELS